MCAGVSDLSTVLSAITVDVLDQICYGGDSGSVQKRYKVFCSGKLKVCIPCFWPGKEPLRAIVESLKEGAILAAVGCL